jgi:hypothetical protein
MGDDRGVPLNANTNTDAHLLYNFRAVFEWINNDGIVVSIWPGLVTHLNISFYPRMTVSNVI